MMICNYQSNKIGYQMTRVVLVRGEPQNQPIPPKWATANNGGTDELSRDRWKGGGNLALFMCLIKKASIKNKIKCTAHLSSHNEYLTSLPVHVWVTTMTLRGSCGSGF